MIPNCSVCGGHEDIRTCRLEIRDFECGGYGSQEILRRDYEMCESCAAKACDSLQYCASTSVPVCEFKKLETTRYRANISELKQFFPDIGNPTGEVSYSGIGFFYWKPEETNARTAHS